MSLKLDQIAHQVFDALAHDYAGMAECDDRLGAQWDALVARSARTRLLNDRLLYQYVTQRLASLGDHNLCFLAGPNCSYTPETCGFDVRRHEDALFVTRAGQDGRVHAGDALTTINNSSLDAHLERVLGNPTGSDDPARQAWAPVLAQASHSRVRRTDGSMADLRLRRFPSLPGAAGPCSLATRDDGTIVLTVTQLDNGELGELIDAHACELAKAPRLVIDVRSCVGGAETNAYPLLDYLFDEDGDLHDIEGPEVVLTNYTVANCHRREMQIAQLRALARVRDDDETRTTLSWLDDNLETVRANRGKGYVEEVVEADSLPVHAGPKGQHVLLLTDVTCGDAAEWLVRLAQGSPRVTTVGRATMGTLDYANPLAMAFEDRFIFVYPMSKTKAAAEGRGMRGIGITPDIVVPFTPRECTEDVVLARALEA